MYDSRLMAKIKRSAAGAFSGSSRTIYFMKACFDSGCDRFVAGDHQGYIYLFDLSKNRSVDCFIFYLTRPSHLFSFEFT